MLVAQRTLLRYTLAMADAITIALAFAAGFLLNGRLFESSVLSFADDRWLALIVIACWLPCLAAAGLYTSACYANSRRLLKCLIWAHVLAAPLVFACFYITGFLLLSRFLPQAVFLLGFAGLLGQRFVLKTLLQYLRHRDLTTRGRVLLVGTPERTLSYLDFIEEHRSLNIEVVGFLDAKDAVGRGLEFKRN